MFSHTHTITTGDNPVSSTRNRLTNMTLFTRKANRTFTGVAVNVINTVGSIQTWLRDALINFCVTKQITLDALGHYETD